MDIGNGIVTLQLERQKVSLYRLMSKAKLAMHELKKAAEEHSALIATARKDDPAFDPPGSYEAALIGADAIEGDISDISRVVRAIAPPQRPL